MSRLFVITKDALEREEFTVFFSFTLQDFREGTFTDATLDLVQLRYIVFAYLNLVLYQLVDLLFWSQASKKHFLPQNGPKYEERLSGLDVWSELIHNALDIIHAKALGDPSIFAFSILIEGHNEVLCWQCFMFKFELTVTFINDLCEFPELGHQILSFT